MVLTLPTLGRLLVAGCDTNDLFSDPNKQHGSQFAPPVDSEYHTPMYNMKILYDYTNYIGHLISSININASCDNLFMSELFCFVRFHPYPPVFTAFYLFLFLEVSKYFLRSCVSLATRLPINLQQITKTPVNISTSDSLIIKKTTLLIMGTFSIC